MISSIPRSFHPLLIFIISSLLIQTGAFSHDSPDTICIPSSPNYTINYENNLNNLLSDLDSKTSPTGFWNGSSGQGYDQAYGLALCRGDLRTAGCSSCISEAIREITSTSGCPGSRAAIIWYDNCYLKYSDYDFFGEIDDQIEVNRWNIDYASNPVIFNATAIGLLSNLSKNASDTTNKYMFASGEIFEPVENVTIYGMAQCSRDLSYDYCKQCLAHAVEQLDGHSVGGRFLCGSCIMRYENHNFINDLPKVLN